MDNKKSTEGLNEITGCKNLQRTIDVIFIHGLDGDACTTWQSDKEKKETFWPQWLGKELPNVGVWSLGYAVSPFSWKGTTMPLSDRATNVLNQLKLKGIGSHPIVFVCHSLGGLLVKQMLRHANDFGDNYQQIADQTRGIVFLSTPHSGSNIANWIKYLKILLPTVSVEELKAHHPHLRELNLWFRNHSKTPLTKILVYCEKLPLNGLLVVDETSADPGIRGVIPIPMDNNHETICKPKNKGAQIYLSVKQLIEQIVANSEINQTERKIAKSILSFLKIRRVLFERQYAGIDPVLGSLNIEQLVQINKELSQVLNEIDSKTTIAGIFEWICHPYRKFQAQEYMFNSNINIMSHFNPQRAIKSVVEIREYLSQELIKIDSDSKLAAILEQMRAACCEFLSRVEFAIVQYGPLESQISKGRQNEIFWAALLNLQILFRKLLPELCMLYEFDIPESIRHVLELNNETSKADSFSDCERI